MKTIILFILALFLGLVIVAQPPQSFKYQAIARDNSGNILANKNVTFRISILQGTITGSVIYSEIHFKTTNSYGLVDLEIGKGTSPTGSFSAINWGTSSYFINIEMDPLGGITFQFMGVTQLVSVPYALYAKDVLNNNDADADPTNEIQDLSLTANSLKLSKSAATVNLAPYLDNTDSQTLNYSGNVLTISSGNSVTITTGTAGDNWGTQSATTDPTLAGNGLPATPLKINQQGATPGQSLKWTGTTWQPGNDLEGPWTLNSGNIFFNTGKVGIGKDPGVDLRQFQVQGGSNIAIVAENSTASYTALYAKNNTASGLAAWFENTSGPVAKFSRNLIIQDGTQGIGKVLTSDANGITSWQTPVQVTPAGTDGSIQYNYRNIFTASANLHWDYLNNRLGIGTTTPDSRLEIAGNSSTTSPLLKLYEADADYARLAFQNNSGSNYWAISGYNHASNSMERLVFNNSVSGNVMSFSGNGNVAIGTDPTNTSIKFWVKDDGNVASGYFENNGSYYTLYAKNLGTGPAGYFDGTVRIGGGNTSELNRDQTSTANLVPICYGVIQGDGTKIVAASTSNFTCEKISNGIYEITISGETYSYTSFVTVATQISGPVGVIRVSSASGKLMVYTYDLDGAAASAYFNFVVYKP